MVVSVVPVAPLFAVVLVVNVFAVVAVFPIASVFTVLLVFTVHSNVSHSPLEPIAQLNKSYYLSTTLRLEQVVSIGHVSGFR